MASKEGYQPCTVVDKNGKATTVYRRLDKHGNVMDRSAMPPAKIIPPETLAPSVAATLADNYTVAQNRALLHRAIVGRDANAYYSQQVTEHLKALDKTTLGIITSAFREKKISRDRLKMIERMNNDVARDYAILVSTVSDIDTNADFVHALFTGLRPLCMADDETEYFGMLDLSTDENIDRYSSIMRFALSFMKKNMHSGEYSEVDFGDVFNAVHLGFETGQVVKSDLAELACNRPQDIDTICDIMKKHPIHHAAGIEELLDHKSYSTSASLAEGAL